MRGLVERVRAFSLLGRFSSARAIRILILSSLFTLFLLCFAGLEEWSGVTERKQASSWGLE